MKKLFLLMAIVCLTIVPITVHAQQEGDPFSETYRTVICENCGAVSHSSGSAILSKCEECNLTFTMLTQVGNVERKQKAEGAEFYYTYVGKVQNVDVGSGGAYPAGTSESEKLALDQIRIDIGQGAYDAILRWIYGTNGQGGSANYPWKEVPLAPML